MATTPFIIYTYGNQDIVYETLMSISSFFGGGLIKSMVKLAGITTILLFLFNAVGITTTNPNRPLDLMFFIRFYLLATIFVYIGTPRDIVIQDVMTNSPKVISTPARNSIPLGMVLINSYTSQLFYGIIQGYERYFQTGSSGDPSLSYTKSGMAFGANFVSTLPSASTGDPVFDQNLQNYFGNCGLPIAYSQGGMTSLTQATDIIGFFSSQWQNLQQARFVAQFDNNGVQSIVDCWAAINALKVVWSTNSNSYLAYFAKLAGFSGNQTIIDNFVAAGNATAAQFLDISSSASDAMKQAIAMNIAYKAIQSNATQVNNSSIALSAYDAQQFQQYKAGGELSGTQAARIVPALKNFAEQLLYMLYPFMVFYALLASSFSVVIKYIKFSATINAIPFVYEVLSWGINWYGQSSTVSIAATNGFNLLTASNMYNLNANVVAAANWLSMSVPVLAYALISGSDMAITGLFGHATDPGKGTATSTAGDMAKGNMSMGNTQMDNSSYNNQNFNSLSGNKFNNALDMTMGSPQINDRTATGTSANIGGMLYEQSAKSTQVSMPISVDYNTMAQRQLSNQLNSLHSESGQMSQQYGKLRDSIHNLQSGVSGSHGASAGFDNQISKDLQRAEQLSTSVQGGLSAMGSGVAISAREQSLLQNNMKELQSISDKYTSSSDASIADTFRTGSSLSQSSSKNIADTLSTSQALNKIQSDGVGIKSNLDGAFQQYLHSQGMRSNDMSDGQLRNEAEQFVGGYVQQQFGVDMGAHYNVKDVDSQATKQNIEAKANAHASVVANNTDMSSLNKAIDKIHDDPVKHEFNKNLENYDPAQEFSKQAIRSIGITADVVSSIAGDNRTKENPDAEITKEAIKYAKNKTTESK